MHVLQTLDTPEGTPIYKVHYQGWKKRYDEWVDVCRVLKSGPVTEEIRQRINATTLKRVARFKEQQRDKEPVKKRRSTGGRTSKRAKVQQPDSAIACSSEQEAPPANLDTNEGLDEVQVQVALPDDLKQKLVDDYDLIAAAKLHALPASPTVTEVLADFMSTIKTSSPQHPIAQQVTVGLKEYFRQALPNILLYAAERSQFDGIIANNADVDLCDHYGGVHLLRLFVKLPVLLAHTDMNYDSMQLALQTLKSLMRHLKRNTTRLVPILSQQQQQEHDA
ncbi:hypothetical protein PTSG_04522 [Salpingoeca rosetta]|uniref:Uncharacterized protein n=1 Tax=Salpingoeca rosetta (strain ATCC 50818 / BSB-021) TaxID=946362 RepID=F2U8T7_SALR5|nr:uncharacterized protein PTSG_04522 [Salpingoeca rosetta]EGD72795.1 hypothetical protein PTSG_04522 [Salpingoeca rosetta]|eukprot:XP_004994618.1 hypothetical protein PTSG_04522 [Salpingoeca rosetta]